MPWVAATEINKILEIGGHIFIETQFSFRSHKRLWNFFQFSDLGLELLFSEYMGFKYIEKGMSNPIVGRFSIYADNYLQYIPIKGLYCHSEFFGQKVKENNTFKWDTSDINDLLNNSTYPLH